MASAGIERTMFKLLVLALAVFAVGSALEMVRQLSVLLDQTRRFDVGLVSAVTGILFIVSRFVIVLSLLYWVPKAIRKLFPEVS